VKENFGFSLGEMKVFCVMIHVIFQCHHSWFYIELIEKSLVFFLLKNLRYIQAYEMPLMHLGRISIFAAHPGRKALPKMRYLRFCLAIAGFSGEREGGGGSLPRAP
jgi:hypothetical protein